MFEISEGKHSLTTKEFSLYGRVQKMNKEGQKNKEDQRKGRCDWIKIRCWNSPLESQAWPLVFSLPLKPTLPLPFS
jgi:hypothetical protein